MFTCIHKCFYAFLIRLLLMLFILPAFSFTVPAHKDHIVCFVYHRFGDGRYPSTNIAVDVFRGQLAYLKQNNFTVWTMGRAVHALTNEEEIPSRTVVLTIDDSYHSFYENGLPLLEEFGYQATIYLNTTHVGHKAYMNWDEVRDAQRRGMEIGNHSHAHGHFLDFPDPEERKEQFFDDLNTAQAIFFDSLGFSPDLYSYPYGEYDPVLKKALNSAGFSCASAQYSGVLYAGSDLFEIPRFPMGGPFATLKGFIQKSQMNPIEVISKEPEMIVMQQNPPLMIITLKNDCIDAEFLQCFVNGERNCITEMQEGPDYVRVKIISRDHLAGRRSLYTITAPSKDKKGWCWYSHVWVNTAISEE
ncbi:MAG: hypothetical protein DRI83_02130 [Bacteroidetes bacterium]|nr:MAG: hypothetical protein DRI83_02130 [Bacteroidota bacterium]